MTDNRLRPLAWDHDQQPPQPEACRFSGIDYTPLGSSAALAACQARPADAPFAYVVTPNADHVVRLNESGADGDDLRRIYKAAWLCLNDSRIVARLARLTGVSLPVCTGADLVARLFRDGLIQAEDPVTVIGGTDAIIDSLRSRFALQRLAHHNPPFGFEHDPAAWEACIRFILDHPARYIFLAVGSPRQERLADAVTATGQGTGLGLCIGASLEFLTGAKSRAPLWMQRWGLEWLYRLMTEPRRLWRRYLIQSPRIFLIAIKQGGGRQTTGQTTGQTPGAPPLDPRSKP